MDFKRLFDIIPYQNAKYPQNIALAHKCKSGTWTHYSSEQLQESIDAFSKGLLELGVQKGDKIALITTNNRVEWNIVDMGIMQIGGVNIPIYPTVSQQDLKFVFEHAAVKYCFVNNKSLYEKIAVIQADLPELKAIYTFEKYDGLKHWEEIKLAETAITDQQLEKTKASIDPNELATIIYTSGTTGTPKGVMLSHHNIISNIKSLLPVIPIEHGHRVISFLPMSHIFERTVVYLYLVVGSSVYYAQNLGTLSNDFKEIKPHYFTAVPRILEKIYERIQRKGLKLKGIRKKVFYWALDLGEKYELDVRRNWWYQVKLQAARSLVFNQLIKTFGGELLGIVSGAAALQPKLAKIFTAAGIPVREGYGLTETSPVLSFNRFTPGEARIGTVGIPLPGVEIKIAEEDQEILARGPNVMLGYYKRPDLTKKVIDKEGWFHTGDVGAFINGRFLKITDRKKELFKTSGGKYIAPQAIENRLMASTFIEQVIVVGANRPYASVLIIPAFSFLRDYFKNEKNRSFSSRKAMLEAEEVVARYQTIISDMNKEVGKTETVKKFRLLDKNWTVEKDELTPTLKLKRRVIIEHYKEVIDEIYG